MVEEDTEEVSVTAHRYQMSEVRSVLEETIGPVVKGEAVDGVDAAAGIEHRARHKQRSQTTNKIQRRSNHHHSLEDMASLVVA